MYVILTSKPGQFHTEQNEGLQAVEAWDYLLCGRRRAHFVIAKLDGAQRVAVVDETPPCVVNLIPIKFLEKFDSVERARHELEQLGNGGADYRLERSAGSD